MVLNAAVLSIELYVTVLHRSSPHPRGHTAENTNEYFMRIPLLIGKDRADGRICGHLELQPESTPYPCAVPCAGAHNPRFCNFFLMYAGVQNSGKGRAIILSYSPILFLPKGDRRYEAPGHAEVRGPVFCAAVLRVNKV